jgi:hypothetical protein
MMDIRRVFMMRAPKTRANPRYLNHATVWQRKLSFYLNNCWLLVCV